VITSSREMRVREITARSILNKSGITDWTVNCYAGCQHACTYCYARFASRFTHPGEDWGSFVDVKVNAPGLLEREATRKAPGQVFVSSVCDAWQPLEGRYGLTRQCVEILLRHGFRLDILTKSALAARDLDVLAGSLAVEFGVTITTPDEGLGRLIEPWASSVSERLALIEEARSKGLRTYLFLGPLMPGLSDTPEIVARMLKTARDLGVAHVYVDRLNPRYGVWPALRRFLLQHFPELVPTYQLTLFDARVRAEYARRLSTRIHTVSKGIFEKIHLCF